MKKTELAKLICSDCMIWNCEAESQEKSVLVSPVQISEHSEENGSIKVTVKSFADKFFLITAKRFEIEVGNDAIFILDKISSQLPINVKTRFWIKGGPDLRCNIAEKNKLVLRNSGDAAKFFRLLYQADGNDWLNTAGLMLPDRFSESGGTGLSFYSGLHHTAKVHTMLYGICSDTEQNIARWHFLKEDGFIVRPPSQIGGYRIVLSERTFLVENLENLCDHIMIDL